ncbi:hydrolase [Rhodococcus sp. 15-1154-1]|nr:serine hydrolase [Rhodococcus sp. 15-1154-1]OZF06993.1 hydrolase [Rhodococcus sp. 15-1154-1]
MRRAFRLLLVTTVSTALLAIGTTVPGQAAPPDKRSCSTPEAAADGFERASAAEVGMDAAAVQRAVDFASSRLRTNIQIFRNNCLVGSGPLNDVTGNTPWHLWSSTKSIVSMLAGVAVTQGRLDVDSPIGRYLPAGEGDDAHRAITVRALLTQSSGMDQGIVAEGIVPGLGFGVDAPAQALTLPISQPGRFQYSQLGPDLLAYVVENAVGEDLQAFAQRELFDPIGIAPQDYYWARDRTGHTYGFALMFLPPNDFARLGMLMANDGAWNGRRIIGSEYIRQLRTPSEANQCYGYLFWLNNTPCIGPSFPSQQTLNTPMLAGMPDDAYAMVGFLQQNNFIIPSLGIQVTWNGVLGDVSPDLSTILSASTNSELYTNFFRALGEALPDEDLPSIPYEPTFNRDIDVSSFFDPDILLGTLGLGPDAAVPTGPVAPPLSDAPPGCLVFACLPVSPETPRRTGG